MRPFKLLFHKVQLGLFPTFNSNERKSNNPLASSNQGDKMASSLVTIETPDTSRSGYANLPFPHGNMTKPDQATQAVITHEHGLYQIRPGMQQSDLHRIQNIEQYVTGQAMYPTPVPYNAETQDVKDNHGTGSSNVRSGLTDGSYLQNAEFPVKDASKPHVLHTEPVPVLELHDTLSTITGSGSHDLETPTSQRTFGTISTTETPGTFGTITSADTQVTPKNSTGSSGGKSVHFTPSSETENTKSTNKRDNSGNKGSRNCETQTESVASDNITVHSGIASQGSSGIAIQTSQIPPQVIVPQGQGHFVLGQGGLIAVKQIYHLGLDLFSLIMVRFKKATYAVVVLCNYDEAKNKY